MIRADVFFCTALLLIALMQPTWAATGDKLYIQKDDENVRTGPSASNHVLLKLNKGHELVEFSRQDEWIHVGIARTGGKTGWIHSSGVGSVFSGGATVAPADSRFDAFVRDIEKLNNTVKPISGFPFFTKVENLGDGIVQLTAHNQWLAASRDDRASNLNTLFNLWSAHEASGLPIAVYIVDSSGNIVMRKSSVLP